jgi:putative acetyltransferase
MSLLIEPTYQATLDVRELIAELDAVLGAEYEPHQRHGLSVERIFEPHMRFFVARLDGLAVGCGGVALFADYAEVKRMYSRPSARRRGVGKALLQRIEDEARAGGKALLCLETGTRQPEAIGLYTASGFRPCAAFGPYAAMPPAMIETSLFFEKPID